MSPEVWECMNAGATCQGSADAVVAVAFPCAGGSAGCCLFSCCSDFTSRPLRGWLPDDFDSEGSQRSVDAVWDRRDRRYVPG